MNYYGWVIRTAPQYKAAHHGLNPNISVYGKFTASDITPNPITDKADFTINVFEKGHLNVTIYDLTGALVMDVISNMFINANTEIEVPLSLGDLPNGVYIVTITLDNDLVMRQLVISR